MSFSLLQSVQGRRSAELPRSPQDLRSPFVFALCQPGAEAVVRNEWVAAGFSPSFSASGFVTAKAPTALSPLEVPQLVFARRVCLSITDVDDAVAFAQQLAARVHHEEGETRGDVAQEGEWIVTSVVRGRAFVGVHRQVPGVSPDPCGDPRLVVPAQAPSRAWLKLEEAARVFPLPLREDDVVVEVGCAPGGMTRALLDRGTHVIGIDKNAMDPRILAEPRFRHVRSSARHVRADLIPAIAPAAVRFLVVDVNLPPRSALAAINGVASALRGSLNGALLTLKLGDYDLVQELPQWRGRIERMLAMRTWAAQLPSNRQELTVFALRTKSAT
jgi:23S rRNA C2498 (ribose-2'-O)-methylase RlmM